MAGYAAQARIERAMVRGRAHRREPAGSRAPALRGRGGVGASAAATRMAASDRIRERLGYIADGWAQLTFYLTDPDSWR